MLRCFLFELLSRRIDACISEKGVRDVLSQFWDDSLGDEDELVSSASPMLQ